MTRNYETELTAEEQRIVDLMWQAARDEAASEGLQLACDDRAERAIDGLTEWVISSRPTPL